jgi:signal peptidase I
MPVEGACRIERTRTIVFLAMCVLIGILASPMRPGVVLGESMAPTFHSGQVFLTSRVAGREALQKGDVVLLAVDDQVFLKRVFALGGESVWLLESVHHGQRLQEVVPARQVPLLLRSKSRYGEGPQLVRLTVPERHVYVLGDSSTNSYDSRHFGPVPLDAVRGRVVVSRLFHLWAPDAESTSVAMARERGRRGGLAVTPGGP